jgi:cob(I)alamin adenosyltransferase
MMKIEDEQQLRYAYEHIVRMYKLIDQIAADTTGCPETREDQIDGVRAMMRKIERDIAAYYEAHPERIQKPAKIGAAAL